MDPLALFTPCFNLLSAEGFTQFGRIRNLVRPKLHHKNVGLAVPHEIKEIYPQLSGGAHCGGGRQ